MKKIYEMPNVAKNLNLLMSAHNTNPTQIAQDTSLNQSTISRISTGQSKSPRLHNLIEITNYFNLPVTAVLNLEVGGQRSPSRNLIITKMDAMENLTEEHCKAIVNLMDLLGGQNKE